VDDPGARGAEPAGVEVEAGQLVPEVDVQPLATGRLGLSRGEADDLGGDALALMVTSHLGIEQEGVVAPVPRDVDEADEGPVGVTGR